MTLATKSLPSLWKMFLAIIVSITPSIATSCAAKTVNLTLDNPKNLDDGDYADLAAQDAAIEGVMDTIIAKNIFHNNGNDLVAKVNARILDYKSTDVMDV